MKAVSRLVIATCVLVCVGQEGCTIHTYRDANPLGQPFSPDCVSVQSKVRVTNWPDGWGCKIFWQTRDRTLNAADVVSKSREFLERSPVASWLDTELIERERTDPAPLGLDAAHMLGFRYPVLKTIVAVSPIVVIVAHEPWSTPSERMDPISWRDLDSNTAEWRLPDGFTYGSMIPSTASLSWFSPSLGTGPISLAGPTDQSADIALTWGTLHFVRIENGWKVECECGNLPAHKP